MAKKLILFLTFICISMYQLSAVTSNSDKKYELDMHKTKVAELRINRNLEVKKHKKQGRLYCLLGFLIPCCAPCFWEKAIWEWGNT